MNSIELRTPCCRRVVVGAPRPGVTEHRYRTCPRCRQRWAVAIRPLGPVEWYRVETYDED